MVLPVRIGLTASALPRMRSTTELRQHRFCQETRAYGRRLYLMSRRLAASGGKGLGRPMSKADEERAKRLAEALRQNLRRRKAQARGLSDPAERHGDDDRQRDDNADR